MASTTNATLLTVDGIGTGVGTSSPWRTLSINGTMALTGETSSSAGNAVCVLSGGEVVTAGAVTCATSSKYTKYDIRTMDGAEAMKEVLALQPVLFDYIDGNRKNVDGIIAEQAAQVAPGIVDYATSKIVLDGHTFNVGDPIGVDPNAEAGLLFKASQYEEGQILAKTTSVAHDAEDNWQWGAIGLLALWNLYLTLRKQHHA